MSHTRPAAESSDSTVTTVTDGICVLTGYFYDFLRRLRSDLPSLDSDCSFQSVTVDACRSSVSSHRKKMMYRILLPLMMTCCDCGTFEVNVTQSFYQLEENQNVTLEWTFTPQDDSSLHSLFIYCVMVTDHDVSRLFDLIGGVKVSEYQDEQFAGRVHWDKDVLKEGRLRLHMSSLRTEDSGLYVCKWRLKSDVVAGRSRLNVTAAAHEPQTQRLTVRPGEESRGRTGLYAGLGLLLVLTASAGLSLCVFKKCVFKSADKRENVSAVV
nr:uncharacterized protein LOC110002601 isoform X2 [Labrus bergylta]